MKINFPLLFIKKFEFPYFIEIQIYWYYEKESWGDVGGLGGGGG